MKNKKNIYMVAGMASTLLFFGSDYGMDKKRKEHPTEEVTSKCTKEDLNEKLFDAVKKGEYDAVYKLVHEGADLYAYDRRGWTPLYYTAQYGYLEIADFFISKGISPLVRDQEHVTPLHVLAFSGNITQYWIYRFKNGHFLLKDIHGFTPLHYLIIKGYDKDLSYILRQVRFDFIYNNMLLKDNGALWKSLVSLAQKINKEAVVDMLNEIVIDMADKELIRNGYLITPELLTILGACTNVHAPVPNHMKKGTLLHIAAHERKLEIIELLLRKGANVNVRDTHQRTPLHYLLCDCETINNDIVLQSLNLLVEHGADIYLKDIDGCDAIQAAINLEINTYVKYLKNVDVYLHGPNTQYGYIDEDIDGEDEEKTKPDYCSLAILTQRIDDIFVHFNKRYQENNAIAITNLDYYINHAKFLNKEKSHATLLWLKYKHARLSKDDLQLAPNEFKRAYESLMHLHKYGSRIYFKK